MLQIETGLGNYYGEIYFIEDGGEYFMELDDCEGPSRIKISELFFNAAKREFPEKKGRVE